ncbi:3-phosphoshikimate 1-carboxyvinyltransferase [Rhabdochlamydiaceae symbiont of Dictyostelium giganteum]|uniref:3-phosphoshikimate 1-carboxyvinyltransferase n=1 Tax=Rhabdochlamydiaceae symbiont of Dictyostelium giganteum TaxID=3342349 RepID=UPI00384B4A38
MRDQVTIYPSRLSGEITIPPSKSQTMRALLFASLAEGESVIKSSLPSPDTKAMIKAISLLGSSIQEQNQELKVIGGHTKASDIIDAGNSGQILRFIGAVSALLPSYTVITGDHSLKTRRPVKPLIDGLNQLGAFATTLHKDHAPILIKGPLKGGVATISGEDSQPVSGLLMAAAFAHESSEIRVTSIGETPWIDLTLSWFDRLGITYHNNCYQQYQIPGRSQIKGFEYTVAGDWSSALYPLAAALVTQSEVTLHGLDFQDAQGDKKVMDLLMQMGASFTLDEKARQLTVKRSSLLKGQTIDVSPFVDAITLLPVIACYATTPTVITGGKITRLKESDRIHAIVTELKKMGALIEEKEDGMIITPSTLYGAHVNTYHDHRMALALSIAALGAKGPTTIQGVGVVNKSFPNYFKELKRLGVHLE